MLKFLNHFIKLLFIVFILILATPISVSQPIEPKQATKCTTKCVKDMEKLAQLKQACRTMTMSKCNSHCGARTERNAKSSRKCFNVNTNRNSTKSECVQLLQNNSPQRKSCYAFVCFCFYPDGVKFLEQEIRKAGTHSIQEGDIMMNNSTATPTNIRTTMTQSTGQGTTNFSNIASTPTTLIIVFNDWEHRLLVVAGALLLLLGSILAVVLFKYCKIKKSGSIPNYTLSSTPTLDQNEVQNSPVYCEADISYFSSSERHPEKTIRTEVDRSTTDFESNSEDEYCYPEDIEDEHAPINPVNPLQTSGEYACAYDHVNFDTDYLNTLPHQRPTNGVEDDYEYPENSRSSSDNEYRYAYDWWDPGFREASLSSSESVQAYTPLDKDRMDDNLYDNYQSLLGESLEKENEMEPLEYVTVQ